MQYMHARGAHAPSKCFVSGTGVTLYTKYVVLC